MFNHESERRARPLLPGKLRLLLVVLLCLQDHLELVIWIALRDRGLCEDYVNAFADYAEDKP
jgi:GDP-D-mannose dehydratase